MNNREDILAEIESVSASVAAIPFVNVFTVEDTYFSRLPKIIMAQINVDSVIDSKKNFTVPDGYFESLAGNILNKIHALENDVTAELIEISPLLAGIENKETYTVPDGYFHRLSFVEQKETATIISINKPRSFFRYVAAAVITGLLGLSIVNIVDKSSSENSTITTAEVVSTITTPTTVEMNSSFDEALLNVSDNEIEQYLQRSGQDVKAALVASSTDDTDKLPEATDYLMDENVLENYLKENNLDN